MKSVYIHIPFCEEICSYCDFCKVYYNEIIVSKYLEALKNEILETYKGETISTIYIGGGTPSSLNISELKKLFEIIKIFKVTEDCEITIEGNFENTTLEKLNLYKSYGVNRLSFGIETTNEQLLKFLNRTLDKEQVIEIINYSKSIGISNINVDLIYAIPGETIADLKNDLDFILSLGIKHISTYSLIIEDNTILKVKGCNNIFEDLDYEMYMFISNYLEGNGFKHYEISNFSFPLYESKHNLVYWNNQEYYGFGVGASSYLDRKRGSNSRSITNYCLGRRNYNYDEVSLHDLVEYEIMLSLRTSKGIDKSKFLNLYGKSINKWYNYSELIDKGFIEEDDNNIWIVPSKWYVSNEIIVQFLEGEIDG